MIEIRRAHAGDLEQLLPLVAGYRAFYKQEPDAQRERAFMEEHLRNGTSIVFVAEEDGRAVGFTQLFPAFSTVHLGPSLILEDLFVDRACRGKGVATRLLEAAIAHARAIGASGMFLETAMDNVGAQSVYERAGWTREGRFFKYNAPL